MYKASNAGGVLFRIRCMVKTAIQVEMSLMQHTLVLLVVVGFTNAICDDCNEITQICVGVGNSSTCECRPALYLFDGDCIKTNSYSTEVELAEDAYGVGGWTDELANQESEEFLELSQSICDAFEGVLSGNNSYQDDYYGCETVAFFEGSVVAIVLSFYNETTSITSSELEDILVESLPATFDTSTLTTADADECELGLDDCHPSQYGICTDEGAGGYTCTCSEESKDFSPANVTGRYCIISDPHWNIVWISSGASVGLFILLLVLVVGISQFAVTGSSIYTPEKEKRKSGKHHNGKAKKSDKNDEVPLQRHEDEEAGGVVNDAFETTGDQPMPENIFDIDEEQMAALAHIHSIIENHHNRSASLHLPSAQTSNQLPLERVPSVDYGPDYRPSSAVYQNSRQSQKYGRPNLVRLPSGEYLEPMSINQRPPPRQISSRPSSRPTSYNFGDEPTSSGIYATRFPSYVERTPTSPTSPEPYLSRQSSSVFLPSSPRHSRNLSNTSTVYYNK